MIYQMNHKYVQIVIKFHLCHQNLLLIRTMKISLNVKKLKGQFKQKEPIKLVFKFGEQTRIETELSHYRSGCYAFMEKHYLNIPQKQKVTFIEIQIQTESRKVLSLITVFYVKFKQFTKIDLSNKSLQTTLYYELKEDQETHGGQLQRQLTEQTQIYDEETDRLKVFEFGLIVLNFSQRIDIVVFIWKKIKAYFLWKNPTVTLLLTVLLTLLIYYIKISIFIGGTLLYFFKDTITKKFERIHKYDVVKGRILFPQQNALFIRNLLHAYTQLYDSVTQIFFSHDKTFLINIIQFICKLGLLNIFLLYFFDFQYILIILLWAGIALFSPAKQFIIEYTKRVLLTLLGEYFKIVDKITMGINDVIKKSLILPDYQHVREFYYYQYDSWSMFQGWTKDKQKLSDQSFECIATMKTCAPEGWAWTTEWKIDYSDDVDEEGFQYHGRFAGTYSSSSALSTHRRRKWKRICIQNPYQ